MTSAVVWSPTKHCPTKGPNLPPVVSQIGSDCDWPMRPYGNRITGRVNGTAPAFPSPFCPSYHMPEGYFVGIFPEKGDSGTQRRPTGWPYHSPSRIWCILPVQTH